MALRAFIKLDSHFFMAGARESSCLGGLKSTCFVASAGDLTWMCRFCGRPLDLVVVLGVFRFPGRHSDSGSLDL